MLLLILVLMLVLVLLLILLLLLLRRRRLVARRRRRGLRRIEVDEGLVWVVLVLVSVGGRFLRVLEGVSIRIIQLVICELRSQGERAKVSVIERRGRG